MSAGRCDVPQKLYSEPAARVQTVNIQPRAEYLVEVLLFGAEVFRMATHGKTQLVAVKSQTPLRIRNADGRVVDAEEKVSGFRIGGLVGFGLSLIQ